MVYFAQYSNHTNDRYGSQSA